jgi:Tfp pilus assembly protein PilO
MKSGDEIWRQRLWVWVPALVFFLANAGAFTVYRLGYAGNVQSLGRNIEEQKDELKRLTAERVDLEKRIGRADENRRQVDGLYKRFATRRQRLTDVTAEVQSLARKAGLDPRSISYPEQEIEDYGLVKRSFAFSVDGNYVDLRKFINLLELSDSFLVLEEANLAESSRGPELRINLILSTLFTRERPKAMPGAAGTVGATS